MDFLGLKGKEDRQGKYSLMCSPLADKIAKQNPIDKKFENDISLYHFTNRFISPNDLDNKTNSFLAAVYARGDKELAHMTSTFDDDHNTEETLIKASSIVEELIKEHLYKPL